MKNTSEYPEPLAGAVALAALLSSCATPSCSAGAAAETRRLPGRRRPAAAPGAGYRDQLAPDGFARFLDRGAWFADAHYGHAFTVTAAGHATMLTGAYPHRSGIIGNDWRDPATGERGLLHRRHRAPPTSATRPSSSTAPARRTCKAETVGDVLRRVDAAVQGDRHLRQGPRRHPARRQDRHRLHVHERERAVRVQHLLHEAAPGLGRRLQRRASPRTATSRPSGSRCWPTPPMPSRCPTASRGSARAAASCR